jgi:hypothetical protein
MIKTSNLLTIALTSIIALVPVAAFAANGKASPSTEASPRSAEVNQAYYHHKHHHHHKHHRKSWKYSKRSLSQQSY